MKTTLQLILTALACTALFACQSGDKKSSEQTDQQAENISETKENVIRVPIIVTKPFDHITNIGSADIVFTHGDYKVEIEGDSAMIELVKTVFDSNLLTISTGTDGNPDYNRYNSSGKVTIYISAPSLKCLAICNAGNFTCTDKWQCDDIQIGIYGSGKIALNEVECDKFLIEASDGNETEIKHLKADNATLNSRCDGKFTIDCDVNTFSIVNAGQQTINLTGNIKQKYIYNTNDSNLTDSTE